MKTIYVSAKINSVKSPQDIFTK